MQTGISEEKAVRLLEPGDMFGDYTVEKLLGKGGMGAVYLVRAPGGERYAVKVMFPEIADKNQDYRTRFAREAEFAMTLRHKNLIQVYDAGEDPDTGLCYIIMDYVPGGSVKDRLREHGRISVAEAVSITAQIAIALELAHRHGVIHRDIKPDNIMFDADGTPKLADLGVAKFTDEAHKTTVTTTGMIIGTPAYMAPEQMMDSHHVDARADIYALGVVLYEMLTGKRPTEGSTAVELLAKALKGEPLPDVRTMRPEISAAIAHVLSLMCAPKPEDRPPTTLAVAQLLQQAATGQLKLPKKKPRAADAQKAKRPFPVAACVMGALVLGAAVFGWRAWSSRQKATTGPTGVPPVAAATSTALPTEPTGGPSVADTAANSDAAVRGSGTLAASDKNTNALYCVVDLSAGPNAAKYPVSYLSAEPNGGWTDEFKTTKLVLRRIEPGNFKMEGKFDVTITKAFYIGVFEVTQRQYELVTGGNPSESNGDTRPVEKVSYDMIRGKDAGARWPASSAVDSSSFMGKLRTRTGIDGFDLPTEAQWEYACRAGTASMYNNGGDSKGDLMKLGRFALNQKRRGYREADVDVARHEPDGKGGCLEGHTVAGSYLPNAWGLYDMHGNVWEWCLDWWNDRLSSGGTNSVGWSSGTSRVARGGCWYSSDADDCTSSGRNNYSPSSRLNRIGFRVVVGPDLLKERGIAPPKPEGSSSVASASSALGSGTPAAAPATGEKRPKETSPRPKPLVLDLGDGVKMEMVGCPSGKFMMGIKGSLHFLRKEHSVVITRPFWFGKYPVTVEQWERLMPHVEPPLGVKRKDVDPKLPVQVFENCTMGLTGVSAEEFMSKLTQMFRRQLPRGYVFRFPTEAEWEYVLKANSTDPHDPYANPIDVSGQVKAETYVLGKESKTYWIPRGIEPRLYERMDWFIGPYIPVGRKKPNAWGIYDMGGITSEPMLDSWVTTHEEWFAESNPWKRLNDVHARFPQVADDGVCDPLIFEADKANAVRLRWARQGFTDSLRNDDPKDTPDRSRHYLYYWFDVGKKQKGAGIATKAVMLRLVVGPDLLKERGITPPKPSANGRDAQSPSANGQDVRSPNRAASPGAEPFKLLSERPKPLAIKLGKGEQLELMGCPAGTFTMGYEGGAPAHVPHTVTISRPFWIGKIPVTRAQWECISPALRCEPAMQAQIDALGGAQTPQTCCSRRQIDEFIEKLNRRHAKALPAGFVFRLPTLAEWEYACRANGDPEREVYARPKMWGAGLNERAQIGVLPSEKREMLERKGVPIDAQRWKGAYWQVAASVATRKPNAWGLYDMLGNQAEIALDTFSSQVMRDIEQGFYVVKSPDDLPWIDKDVDPLFWNDGDDAAYLRIDSLNVHGWGENAIWFMKQNARLGYCDGFRLVVGPDLVKERRSGKSGGTVVGGMRSVSIFPRADTKDNKWKKRAPWRYTMKVPPANWMEPDFRDGTWKRTNKPVGYGKEATLMRMSERWPTSDIWLRRHFTWKEAKVTRVTFDMIHDENVEIYLNGMRILEEAGSNDRWEPFEVPADTFMSAVREGDNVLAVKVHDSAAPRYFDCGLTVETEGVK